MITTRRGVLALALSATVALGPARAQAAGPVVFAAASLKNALDAAAARWASAGHPAPRIAYAASNTLAKQIEEGAPADLFVSADEAWMDALDGHGLLRPGTRLDLLANGLVLVAPKASASPVAIKPGFDLAGALGGGRLAIGAVDSVPAGKYGKAALQTLGAWDGVKDHLAQAESVRAALAFVSRGEAPLGIVYATDAVADAGVAVVGTFPDSSHPPIRYPAALTTGTGHPDAQAFLAFLQGPEARAAFEAQGFTVLAKPDRGS